MGQLDGVRCLITGASRGLGAVLAHVFWEQGATLALVARSGADLDQLIVSLGERPGQTAAAFPADLADPDAAARIIGLVNAKLSGLDVVINNAAIQGPVGPLWENNWNEWLKTLQVDLFSPIAICKHAVSTMIEQGGGVIVNISGGGATGPRQNFTAYATAKSALVRFSETLAEELRPHNVRINCVAPGTMNTAMLAGIIRAGQASAGTKEYDQALVIQRDGGVPMQRVADLCMFLASTASQGITGKLISAVWDPWYSLAKHIDELGSSDVYTLRRIVPKDRGMDWGNDL